MFGGLLNPAFFVLLHPLLTLVADDGTTQVYNLLGLDLLSQDSGSEVRTLLVDGLGSVRLEMVGSVVETATAYTPYGEVLEQTGTSGTAYGFTGEQEDGATGLLYLRARYYDSSLKTFMSRDPWEGDGQRPETLNYYSYVYNNPVEYIDPSGHYAAQDDSSTCPPGKWCPDGDATGQIWKDAQEALEAWEAAGCSRNFSLWCVDENGYFIDDPAFTADKETAMQIAVYGYGVPLAAAGTVCLGPTALTVAGQELAKVSSFVSGLLCGDGDCTNEVRSSYEIGEEGAQSVWRFLKDPTLQTEVRVYVAEAGKRANYFARLDGLTSTAIHEVKNASKLSLSQRFMDQAYRYKLIADGMEVELHYWLTNSAPSHVVQWLRELGAIVHTGAPGP